MENMLLFGGVFIIHIPLLNSLGKLLKYFICSCFYVWPSVDTRGRMLSVLLLSTTSHMNKLSKRKKIHRKFSRDHTRKYKTHEKYPYLKKKIQWKSLWFEYSNYYILGTVFYDGLYRWMLSLDLRSILHVGPRLFLLNT